MDISNYKNNNKTKTMISTLYLVIPVISFGFSNANQIELLTSTSFGDESCPCLSADELNPIDASDRFSEKFIGVNTSTYGVGCYAHDKNVNKICLNEKKCISHTSPKQATCDLSWCDISWCYVSPSNCNLNHKRSYYLTNSNRYYSYATCGNMDRYVSNELVDQLSGKTFQVAYLKNSGGWKGSYSKDGHFAKSGWTGPTVEFFDRVALEGGFTINITSPPESLVGKSLDFYGTTSPFSYCVYATALGYLDFCVALFTITNERVASTPFFTIISQPVYLYIFNTQTETDTWETFLKHVAHLFAPFSFWSWVMIFCVVLPLISFMLMFHEDKTLPEPRQDQSKYLYKFFFVVAYIFNVIHGFFAESYHGKPVTIGGKLVAMGLSFFTLVTVATYTANLAAIFTEDVRQMKIESIDDAIRAGYTFCGERYVLSSVMSIYDIADLIVPDPEDGLPGFVCPTCNARARAFDFMKSNHNYPSLYCNAAIATSEDIEVMWSNKRHCNKTSVGEPLMYIDEGIPLNEAVQLEMSAILQDAKNRAVFRKILKAEQPPSICPQVIAEEFADESEASMSLTVEQMSGIWVTTGLFLLASLLVPLFTSWITKISKKQTRFSKTEEEEVYAPSKKQSRSSKTEEEELHVAVPMPIGVQEVE